MFWAITQWSVVIIIHGSTDVRTITPLISINTSCLAWFLLLKPFYFIGYFILQWWRFFFLFFLKYKCILFNMHCISLWSNNLILNFHYLFIFIFYDIFRNFLFKYNIIAKERKNDPRGGQIYFKKAACNINASTAVIIIILFLYLSVLYSCWSSFNFHFSYHIL